VKETLSPGLLQKVLQYARERQRDESAMDEETQTEID